MVLLSLMQTWELYCVKVTIFRAHCRSTHSMPFQWFASCGVSLSSKSRFWRLPLCDFLHVCPWRGIILESWNMWTFSRFGIARSDCMSITHACIVRRGEFREVLFPENLSARFESESSVLRVGNAAPQLSGRRVAHVHQACWNFANFRDFSFEFHAKKKLAIEHWNSRSNKRPDQPSTWFYVIL